MDVTIKTDAFPQPHRGDPIKLTKGSKITIAVPADLLDKGVAIGVVHDGESIPSTPRHDHRGFQHLGEDAQVPDGSSLVNGAPVGGRSRATADGEAHRCRTAPGTR